MLQGTRTWLLANDDGQIELTHSVSAGLDYAAIARVMESTPAAARMLVLAARRRVQERMGRYLVP